MNWKQCPDMSNEKIGLTTLGIVIKNRNDTIQHTDKIMFEVKSMIYDKHLIVMVVPHAEIEFKPPYTYERYVETYMRPRVRHGVKRFLEKSLETIESLEIRWVGHEPLLRMEVIEEISDFVKCGLEFYGKRPYKAILVTTGYFLDAIRVKKLISLGIQRYQISLEHSSEECESESIMSEHILNNMKELAQLPEKYVFRVTIWSSVAEEADIEQFQKEIGFDSRIVLKRRTSKTEKETEGKEEPRRAYVFRANGEIETFDIRTGKDKKIVGEVDKYGTAQFYALDEEEKSNALS